jgi:hypothetical protein
MAAPEVAHPAYEVLAVLHRRRSGRDDYRDRPTPLGDRETFAVPNVVKETVKLGPRFASAY